MINAQRNLARKMENWRQHRDKPLDLLILEVVRAKFQYLEAAMRQRGQLAATLTLAADFDYEFATQNLRRANAVYDQFALELRKLRPRAGISKAWVPIQIANMKFQVLEASVGLNHVDYKQVRRKHDRLKTQLKKMRRE